MSEIVVSDSYACRAKQCVKVLQYEGESNLCLYYVTSQKGKAIVLASSSLLLITAEGRGG